MKKIQISIPEMGRAVGTLGWLSTIIEDMQKSIKISQTTTGMPCLTYQDATEGKRYIIATPYIHSEHYKEYKNIDGIATIRAVGNDFQCGIFKSLTPAAEKACSEWIEKNVEQFKEQLEAS